MILDNLIFRYIHILVGTPKVLRFDAQPYLSMTHNYEDELCCPEPKKKSVFMYAVLINE